MTRALVTGAGHRLGRAMALTLGQRGYDVAVHYASSREGAQEVVDELRAMGRNAQPVQADLLNLDEMEGLLPRAAEALGGKITCLINNASIFEYDNIDTATRESWDRHINSNLRAPFVLSQAMSQQGLTPGEDENGEAVAAGVIVNMIDQRVRKPTPEFMTYGLAKMGLWALTQTLSQALAPAIRVNAIGPGPTLKGGRQSEEHFRKQREALILERGPDPSDICRTLEYFLDMPSVTGQLVCVDGGQHLAWRTPDVVGVE
ncbi:SDR family oxidoreductase [Sulfitobacter sp. HNIBRBA3233]|uniref:SDR family oxidoreductase n=1 Tax=Sulfitobacter marinivivus TaxID=3158558 RepID=UPI0032DFC1A4